MSNGELLSEYLKYGYRVFDQEQQISDWIASAIKHAQEALVSPDNRHWYRYQNTWFVGVNVLNNRPDGSIGCGPELGGRAISFIEQSLTNRPIHLDRGQISVCFDGYPKKDISEPKTNHAYRLRRDAAHIDGVMKHDGDRYLVEHHDYILGIAMNMVEAQASPFVVWQGSHRLMQTALCDYLSNYPKDKWRTTPISEVYSQTRKRILNECRRVELALKPGQALVAHRHLLHGTAPWKAVNETEPRMLCFFRPESMTVEQWLTA